MSDGKKLSPSRARDLAATMTGGGVGGNDTSSWASIRIARSRISGQGSVLGEFLVELPAVITIIALSMDEAVYSLVRERLIADISEFDMVRTGRLLASLYSVAKPRDIASTVQERCLKIMAQALGAPGTESSTALEHIPQIIVACCNASSSKKEGGCASVALEVALKAAKVPDISNAIKRGIRASSISEFVIALYRYASGKASEQERAMWTIVKPSQARKALSLLLKAARTLAKAETYNDIADWSTAASIIKGIEWGEMAYGVTKALKSFKANVYRVDFHSDVVVPIARALLVQYAAYDPKSDDRTAEAKAMCSLFKIVAGHLSSMSMDDPLVSSAIMDALLLTGTGTDKVSLAHLFPQFTMIVSLDAERCAEELDASSQKCLVDEVTRILLGGKAVFDGTLQRTRKLCASLPSKLMTMIAKHFEDGVRDAAADSDAIIVHLEAVRGLLGAGSGSKEGADAFLPLLTRVLEKTMSAERLLSQAFTLHTAYSVAATCVAHLSDVRRHQHLLELIVRSVASTFLSSEMKNSPQTRISSLDALKAVILVCTSATNTWKGASKLSALLIETTINAFEETSSSVAELAADAAYLRQLKGELINTTLDSVVKLSASMPGTSKHSLPRIIRRLVLSFEFTPRWQ